MFPIAIQLFFSPYKFSGYVGTVALMKLAVGMPVIEKDNVDIQAPDNSQCETCIVTNETLNMELSSLHQPISVLTSCNVNKDNFGLVKQALILHTILDLKVTSLSVIEVGRRKVKTLLSLVEVSTVVSGIVFLNN